MRAARPGDEMAMAASVRMTDARDEMLIHEAQQILQVQPNAEPEVIQAAYRALAKKYHPDHDTSADAARRMREINDAYQQLRNGAPRKRWGSPQAMHAPPPPRSAAAGTRLSFGRYTGWTLRDLARQDPDYLRWLSRTASGIGYRTEIYQILGRMGAAA
jgi:curved DNA-binding protein CbpA